MKTFKRIQATVLAIIMAIMSLCTTTAFAAEIPTNDVSNIVSYESNTATPNVMYRSDTVSITTSKSAAGGSFAAIYSNTINFTVKCWNLDSTSIVAVRLHDRSTGQMVREWQFSSSNFSTSITIEPQHTYIFEYLLARGNTTVRITNDIYP